MLTRMMVLATSLILLWSCGTTGPVMAQGGNQGGNGGTPPGGILIDPDGSIRRNESESLSSSRLKKLLSDAKKKTAGEVDRVSSLRCVSLQMLEKECNRLLTAGTALPVEIACLAGLTRIDYVCFVGDSDSSSGEEADVILAGPAEPVAVLPGGRAVGTESGRPVVLLDDFLVALRNVRNLQPVGCSFDPDPQRLAASQQYLNQNQQQNSVRAGVKMFERMAEVLGNWKISVFGVPQTSRMALAMVEADYMLKQLTLGRENPGVRGFRSQLMLLKPGEDIMRRWWFVISYDAIETDSERRCFHLSGSRIQLKGQDEVTDASGNRRDADTNRKSTELYASQFTEKIDELAAKVIAFADLQNLIDVLTVNAIIRRSRDEGVCQWNPGLFADETALPAAQFAAPAFVPSLSNARTAGRGFLVGLVAGGVSVDTRTVLDPAHLVTADREFPVLRPVSVTPARWWWDVSQEKPLDNR